MAAQAEINHLARLPLANLHAARAQHRWPVTIGLQLAIATQVDAPAIVVDLTANDPTLAHPANMILEAPPLSVSMAHANSSS